MNKLKSNKQYLQTTEILPLINRGSVSNYFDLQRLKVNYKSYASSASAGLQVIQVNKTYFVIDDVEKYLALRSEAPAMQCEIYEFWENRKHFENEIPNFIQDVQSIYSLVQIYKYFNNVHKWSVDQWSLFLQISLTQMYKVRQLAQLHDETINWFYNEQMILDFALDVAKVIPDEIQPKINMMIQTQSASIFEYFEIYKAMTSDVTNN
jgi:hypothetical protein